MTAPSPRKRFPASAAALNINSNGPISPPPLPLVPGIEPSRFKLVVTLEEEAFLALGGGRVAADATGEGGIALLAADPLLVCRRRSSESEKK